MRTLCVLGCDCPLLLSLVLFILVVWGFEERRAPNAKNLVTAVRAYARTLLHTKARPLPKGTMPPQGTTARPLQRAWRTATWAAREFTLNVAAAAIILGTALAGLAVLGAVIGLFNALLHPAAPLPAPASECAALLRLGRSLGAANWSYGDGSDWSGQGKHGADCCEWFLVTCVDGHVISIEIVDENATGTLDGLALAALPELELLAISNNPNVVGEIPPEIGSLDKLQHMDLHCNGLTGALPDTLGGMSKLTQFDVAYNQLGGELPAAAFQGLPALEKLRLTGNAFVGEVPSTIGDLGSLAILGLGENPALGSPAMWDWLPRLGMSLQQLYLHDMPSLAGPVPALGTLPALEVAWLFNSSLSGPIPRGIAHPGNALQYLDLSHNNITGRLPTMYLTHLDYLDMRHNALTGAVPGFCNNKLLIRGGDCQLREQSTGPFKCNTTGYPWCLSEPYSACYAECVP